MTKPSTRSPMNSRRSFEPRGRPLPWAADRWVRASRSRLGWWKTWPRIASKDSLIRTHGSMDGLQQTAPADLERPFPEFPPGVFGVDREEQDLGASDEVFDRHKADAIHERGCRRCCRGCRPSRRRGRRARGIPGVLFTQPSSRSLRMSCLHAVRQRLLIQLAHHLDAVVVGEVVALRLAGAKLAIDVELALRTWMRSPGRPMIRLM